MKHLVTWSQMIFLFTYSNLRHKMSYLDLDLLLHCNWMSLSLTPLMMSVHSMMVELSCLQMHSARLAPYHCSRNFSELMVKQPLSFHHLKWFKVCISNTLLVLAIYLHTKTWKESSLLFQNVLISSSRSFCMDDWWRICKGDDCWCESTHRQKSPGKLNCLTTYKQLQKKMKQLVTSLLLAIGNLITCYI